MVGMVEQRMWSDAELDAMSWHDNHVHGLQLRAGPHGAGELVLDIDFILAWLCEADGSCRFRIAPATLTFHAVTDLRMLVDYAASAAALTPFAIAGIRRIDGPGVSRWTIALSWPEGAITFRARGFTQVQRGEPVVSDEQWLAPEIR